MIAADQPAVFPEALRVAVSSRQDGTMLSRSKQSFADKADVSRRRQFCDRAGVAYDDCVYQIISYGEDMTYDSIVEVGTPHIDPGVEADVLYTEQPGVGLFLPTADCIATVLYDTKRHALALAHLGRHASVAKTMTRAVERFVDKGSDAADILIWMAPSVGPEDYVMDYFDSTDDPDWRTFAVARDDGIHLDLAGYNRQLAINAGVVPTNVHTSPVTTARSDDYYSHSHGDSDGRFAVVAMMR